jgi:ABC-type sugar transport system substrate-binding protein
MRIRALLVACLLTALSLIALPANAASAIQFRKIQYDPSGSHVPATNYQLNREYVTITNTGTTTRTLTAGRSVISRTTSTPFPASS